MSGTFCCFLIMELLLFSSSLQANYPCLFILQLEPHFLWQNSAIPTRIPRQSFKDVFGKDLIAICYPESGIVPSVTVS